MDENNPYYIEEEGIIVVQSECNEDEFLPQQRSIDEDDDHDILESSQSLNSIHVENFIKTSHFNDEANISNQIIVQKMDDFMDDSQFNELSIIDTNPENLEQFENDGKNITIISRNINTEVANETVIISDLEGKEITSNYQVNSHFSEIGSTEETENDSIENIFIKSTEEFNASKQAGDENSEFERHAASPLKSISKDYPLSTKKEASDKRKRKKLDYIDKNDPRVRLHFVKFMKKDGKTIKIWECGICSKEFIHQYTLMRHLPIHTDERNYVCKECGKAFRQYSTLTQHKAIHSEHRPYVCDICLKTYTRVSTLAAHKKIHVKEKPYNCPECGKGFHQRGNLKNHMFIHSNIRPYKCDLCNRGFNQASNLQCHKAKVHNIGNVTPLVKPSNKFKCSVCNETFSRRMSLQNHEDYVHGIRSTISSKTSQIDLSSDARLLLKKKKIGNSRIIPLLNTNHNREDGKKMGLLIEPIDTKAMHRTLAAGAIPFALLKPANGSAVVVKIQLCSSSKHMLVPASPAELRAAGKFSVIYQGDGRKAVQIKVPVVATIHQRIGDKGVFHIVEPPSEEDNQLSSQLPNYGPSQSSESLPAAVISSSTTCNNKTLTQHFVINSDVLKEGIKKPVLANEAEEIYLNVVNVPDENVQYVLPTLDECSVIEMSPQSESANDLLAAAVNLVSQSPARDDLDVCESEIQYLRPTENYGEYEVVEPEDATHFASGEGIIDKLKPLMNTNVTMDQSQISALMDALKNAGYELASTSDDVEASNQIILNSVDDTIIVGNEIIHHDDQNDLGSVPMPEGIEVVIKEEIV